MTMNSSIKRLIGEFSSGSELKLFTDMIKQMPATKFALIKISGATLEKHMDEVTTDIAFLNQLGVFPVVVHGAGSKLDRALPNSKKVNGMRVTSDEDMEVIKDIMQQINLQLTLGIVEKGGSAIGLCNVIKAKPLDKRVGVVDKVDNKTIEQVIDGGNQN